MGFFEVFAGGLAAIYAVVKNYGLAIILLTIVVRLILLPLSIKQTRSMREMQRIQPEIKRIQAKHKGDRQKMNEEMMALYKEHNVNPLGGCLPLLMQFPVFIALYQVLLRPLRYLGFMDSNPDTPVVEDWIHQNVDGIMQTLQDSSLARALDTAALKVNEFLGFLRLDCTPSQVMRQEPSGAVQDVACGSGVSSFIPYVILILFMGFTTYYQQRQMQASNTSTDPQAKQMQTFAKVMPFLLMFFSFNFPSGLTLYWLTSNLWTIGQQRLMLRVAPPLSPAGTETKTAKANTTKKPEGDKPPADKQGSRPSGGNGGRSPQASKKKKKR